jgi:hypothetical protein
MSQYGCLQITFPIILLCLISVPVTHSFGASNQRVDVQRRNFLLKTIDAPAVCGVALAVFTNPQKAWCRNLPESTGADLSATGTISKLLPIVRMRASLSSAQLMLVSSENSKGILDEAKLEKISIAIREIPSNEKQFKRIFDEYSDPVSYKQKYMDSNAFLVYYTNGFDGPGRDSIEKDIPKQTLQYGARNDVWNAFEEILVEIKFSDSSSSINDLLIPLNKAIKSLDVYLSYAPKEDVEKAQSQ